MNAPDAEALLAHAGFVRGLARSLLFDDVRADDVVQQAWLAALERPPRDEARLRAWLAAVVRNFARRARRDEGRRSRRERSMPAREPVPSPEEILERENVRRRVVLSVLELEEPYRTTVVLRYLEELPPREVARRMGVPVETVRTRLKRALARLREGLDAAHDGDRRAWSLALVPLALPKAAAAGTGTVLALGVKAKLLAASVVLLGLLALLVPAVLEEPPARARAGGRAAAPEPSGAPAAIAARADGAAVGEAEAAAPPDGATLCVLVTAEGRPVGGAIAFLEREGKTVGVSDPTDALGRAWFRRTGEFTVSASHPGYAPGRTTAVAEEGRVAEARIELGPAAWIDVEVVEAGSGAPLEGAEVLVLVSGEQAMNWALVQSAMDPETFVATVQRFSVYDDLLAAVRLFDSMGRTVLFLPPFRTDRTGNVRVTGLRPGILEAIVSHPRFVDQVVRRDRIEPEARLRVDLRAGATLEVLAPSFEGRPAAGWVCEVDRGGLFPFPVANATFDDAGRVAFPGLPAGAYAVSVSRKGTWDIRVDRGEEDGEETRSAHIGRSTDSARLQRTVTLAEGERKVLDLSAVTGATVEGRLVAGDAVRWIARLLEGEREVAVAGVDAEGAFRFEKVAPGDYRVVAMPLEGSGEVAADAAVGPDDEVVKVELRLELGTLVGAVSGPDGRPLAEAHVFAIPADGAPAAPEPRDLKDLLEVSGARGGSTGEDGTYRIAQVPAGPYDVYCGAQGHLARKAARVAGTEEVRVDFRLDKAHLHVLTVRLVDAHGAPVAGHVTLRDGPAGLLASAVADPDWISQDAPLEEERTFHLQEGRYVLDAFAEGAAPVRDHEVALSGPDRVTLRLGPGLTAVLHVENRQGPLASHEIEVRDAKGRRILPGTRPIERYFFPRPWRTDDAGRVVLPHLAAGRYTVHLGEREIGSFTLDRESIEARIRVPE